MSIGRLLLFLANEADSMRWAKDMRAQLRGMQRDVQSLSDHATYLSNKITFLLDAMLGVVNLEQNNIIKIVLGGRRGVHAADADRLDLRHELQEHAGAGMAVRLSDSRVVHDDLRPRSCRYALFQMEEVACEADELRTSAPAKRAGRR